MMRTTRPPARALRAGARGREGARDSNRPPNASEREGARGADARAGTPRARRGGRRASRPRGEEGFLACPRAEDRRGGESSYTLRRRPERGARETRLERLGGWREPRVPRGRRDRGNPPSRRAARAGNPAPVSLSLSSGRPFVARSAWEKKKKRVPARQSRRIRLDEPARAHLAPPTPTRRWRTRRTRGSRTPARPPRRAAPRRWRRCARPRRATRAARPPRRGRKPSFSFPRHARAKTNTGETTKSASRRLFFSPKKVLSFSAPPSSRVRSDEALHPPLSIRALVSPFSSLPLLPLTDRPLRFTFRTIAWARRSGSGVSAR